MALSRKATHYDEDYDIGNGHDLEKAISYPSSDDEYDTDSTVSSPSSSNNGYNSHDAMLPRSRPRARSYPTSNRIQPPARSRYRIPHRIMRWLCIALMSTIVIFIFSLVRMSALSSKHLEKAMLERPQPPATWENFNFLERYYGGIRTLMNKGENVPEFPRDEAINKWKSVGNTTKTKATIKDWPNSQKVLVSLENEGQKECFLDKEQTVKIPNLQAYNGEVEAMPEAVIGSYEAIGLENDRCYDRYGRLGPYGYGYSLKRGGLGAGLEGERHGSENVWKGASPINYKNIRWGEAQSQCFANNKHRFQKVNNGASGKIALSGRSLNNTSNDVEPTKPQETLPSGKLPRTAVVIRTWRDFNYTPETIAYLRSLISELALLSGGEYTVHFLIHVKDEGIPIWADEGTYARVLNESLPAEFAGMGTLWSEKQMGLIYSGLWETFYRDLPVHGVYRSAHLPLQWFAHTHPEYSFFWNWEMDVRYTGHWHKLFSALTTFADAQPRKGLWERNGRYYIPSVHGSWEDFAHMSRVQSEMPPPQSNNKWANAGPPDAQAPPSTAESPVWGPLAPEETKPLDTDPVTKPASEKDWGVGEPADLITLNPIFDPARTGWLLADDVTGYNTTDGMPPRRASIVTTSRFSRRLLETMHVEVSLHKRSMFSEMFPASMALHHGLKAVYAPHPVFVDRDWPVPYLAGVLNGGLNGASGGARTSVFGRDLEHNLKGVSWYYNSGFSGNLWRRWLGKRVDGGGGENAEIEGEGRMCLPGMLLHPVKEVEMAVEGMQVDKGKGKDIDVALE